MNEDEIEIIDWWDHASGSPGWNSLDSLLANNSVSRIRSVGWVVAENELCLTVASHGNVDDNSEDSYQGAMVILKAAIISRKKYYDSKLCTCPVETTQIRAL